MPVSSLSTDSYSTSSGRFKQRRAALQALADLTNAGDAGASSVFFPTDSRNHPATSGDSTEDAESFSHFHRATADLLGLMARTPALVASGLAVAAGNPQSADFLDDLSWLYRSFPSEEGYVSANPLAESLSDAQISPSPLSRGQSTSVPAANAAYERSVDFA